MNAVFAKGKRLYLINRSFQLRLSRAAVAVGILSTILTSTLILFPLYRFEILRIPRFLPWPILISMGCAVLINVGTIFYLAILTSHRIAGPMFSLHRSMRLITAGHFQVDIKFRKTDELQYISRCFNEMAESLHLMTQRDLEALNQSIAILQSPIQDAHQIQESVLALESLRKILEDRISPETK
jgi:methyl-accepting chemotaxis protein